MRLLFVTSEVFPLIKTGGLADVSGALPIALRSLGVDIHIVLPAYRGIRSQCTPAKRLGGLKVFNDIDCELYQTTLPGTNIPLILVDQPALYDRDGSPYHHPQHGDWQDNPLRFGVLSKVAAILANKNNLLDWQADVVHCNDWQTGLVPYYLKQMGSSVKSAFSIHNIAFQGNFHPDWRHRLTLNDRDFQPEGYEFFGHVSFMKAGLYYADALCTVSPTYAREIQTEQFGFGFQGLLQHRARALTGILNGIDTQAWDPSQDVHLPVHYSEKKLGNKAKVKQILQEELGLNKDANCPLLGVVSRLTHQKGLDLLLEIAQALIEQGCQLAILGGGEPKLEQDFLGLMQRYPGKVSATIGYNEPLSHRMMAGVDIFVMPSRFEPCGLNQMYGLRYGTIPVVANTGGLADSVSGGTVTEDGKLPHNMTGFVLPENTASTLLVTLQQAIRMHANFGHWQQLQKQAMKQDVSWKTSAKHYLTLYQRMFKH
ncbi:glycogen synthase GlgA [Methylophilus aquaticus]|uniref:Glycogen synthase n=1 Tax=Methylophilus aquaticus TaxID=1971610 RepID=A0ABT9JV88_9PROT|nr:glycogen synthase GlgA [Methylophilus aquaticus]MDP8568431.1 glycogen synthase GlgA [Methylophilus aquaticus]